MLYFLNCKTADLLLYLSINGTARIFHATFCRGWYSNLRPSESCTSLRDIVPSPTHLHHNNQVCIGPISGLTKMDRLEAGSTKLVHSVNISSHHTFILIHGASALLGAAKWQLDSKMAPGRGPKLVPAFVSTNHRKKRSQTKHVWPKFCPQDRFSEMYHGSCWWRLLFGING